MMIEQALDKDSKPRIYNFKLEYRLEALRQRINDDNYLRAAIQRLALVMSNEIMDITREGGRHERKRRK